MNPLLVTMRGPDAGEIDLTKLSDFEAGYIVLKKLGEAFPGLTVGQLAALGQMAMDKGTMAGWWTDFTKAVTAPVKEVGSMVGDVFREGGDYIGKGVRLFTDEKVVAGADKAYRGFTESGGVAGFWGGSDFTDVGSWFGGGENGGGEGGFMDWLNGFMGSLGSKAKANQAGMFGGGAGNLILLVGAGFVLAMLFGKREK